MEYIMAKDNKLFIGDKRVGQIILQHLEESGEPMRIYDAPLDRDELINMLLIGKEDFERIVRSGKVWPLLNIPLYSKSYYNGIPFQNVRKSPIDFDFIQIQNRALIYADGDAVRIVGRIDELASYLLVKAGLILGPETVIMAIEYASENNLPLPDVKHPLVRVYTLLKQTNPDVRFESITKEGDFYTIRTTVGYIYFDGKRLANTMKAFNLIRQLPVEEGYLEAQYKKFILHSFKLKSDAMVDFDVDDDGNVELYLAGISERVVLDAKVSLKDRIIVSNERQKVQFVKQYKHLGYTHFYTNDSSELMAEGIIEVEGRTMKVSEHAEALEMTDELEIESKSPYPFGEVVSRSNLLQQFNFEGDSLKYAFFTIDGRSFVLTYGSGVANIRGVLDRGKQHFLISDGLNVRVYRIVRLDDFSGNFVVKGRPNNIDEYVRLMELNLITKIYPIFIKVELSDDVFITIRSRVGGAMVGYAREEFPQLNAYMKLGSVRFGYGEVPLPTDSEGVRVFSVVFGQREEVLWFVGKPLGVPEKTLYKRYVYWNGAFSYAKKKIRPVGIPKDLRPSKELCISDLYKHVICIPVSSQMTLF